MTKLVRSLIRKEGRGAKAPASPRPNFLSRLGLSRLGRTGRGYASAGVGVVAAAVVVVSLLTSLAPDSDRPTPTELVDRILPGVVERVDEQVSTLLEGGNETVRNTVRTVREGLTAATSGLPRLELAKAREGAADRTTGAGSPSPSPAAPSTASNAAPSSSGGPSQDASDSTSGPASTPHSHTSVAINAG